VEELEEQFKSLFVDSENDLNLTNKLLNEVVEEWENTRKNPRLRALSFEYSNSARALIREKSSLRKERILLLKEKKDFLSKTQEDGTDFNPINFLEFEPDKEES